MLGTAYLKLLSQKSVLIKSLREVVFMNSSFDFQMFQPKGRLSAHVQGLWSATTSSINTQNISRWLHSDAGSGVMFILSGEVRIDEARFAKGTIFLPVKRKSQLMTLKPGTQLAGVRFLPSVSMFDLDKSESQPMIVEGMKSVLTSFSLKLSQLSDTVGHQARITILYKWLSQSIDRYDVPPRYLLQALMTTQKAYSADPLSDVVPISQRQLEREFKRRLGMTPKYYQRIIRVKQALQTLKEDPNIELVELALIYGFSDQAHMTREFKYIAQITPKKYSRLVSGGK